jgi:hypothetical protein
MIEVWQSIRASSPRILSSATSFWRSKPARCSRSHTRTSSSQSRNDFTSGTPVMKLHQRPRSPLPYVWSFLPLRSSSPPSPLMASSFTSTSKAWGTGREEGKPSGPRASGLYALIYSPGDRVRDYARTWGDACGVSANDALIDHSAFVLGGIPRANRGGGRHILPRERGIDLGPGLTGLSRQTPELLCGGCGVVFD